MEGHSHDPVSGVESFLHTISVVDVYVDVQHPLVVPGSKSRAAIKQSKYSILERKVHTETQIIVSSQLC